MSSLSHFFNKKKSESVVLIDIGTTSVAGAYVQYEESTIPALLYTRRLPIEGRVGEPKEKSMLRALHILGDTLIREGAPVLARATGSGRADTILVSIDAPWQKTSLRTEHVEQETPFLFTKSLVTAVLEKTTNKASEKILANESVIGVILNGYETRNPYGKKAHRADIVVLTSLIDEQVATHIKATLKGIYHTEHILTIASSSLRYQAIQKTFPHESDALILDATGPSTSIALVHKGLFVSITEVTVSSEDTARSWMEQVMEELAEIAKQYPLPRTIFLLAREAEVASLRQTLDAAHLGKLWLSDNPPKVVSILASHLVGLVRHVTTASPDILLLLMVLFWRHRP